MITDAIGQGVKSLDWRCESGASGAVFRCQLYLDAANDRLPDDSGL